MWASVLDWLLTGLTWLGYVIIAVFAVIATLLATLFVMFRLEWFFVDEPTGSKIVTAMTAYRVVPDGSAWQYLEACKAWRIKQTDNFELSLHRPAHRKAYLVDPGILWHHNQPEPMFPVFAQDYDIFVLDYTGGLSYDRERSAAWVARFIRGLSAKYDEIVYNGVSHGGVHTFYVGKALGKDVDSLTEVKIHDAPAGQKTLLPGFNVLPSFVGGLLLLLGKPGPVSNVPGGLLLRTFVVPPKRDNVTQPSSQNLVKLGLSADMSADDYFTYVCDKAKVNLSGHQFSLWFSELCDMIRAGREMKRGTFPFHVFNNVPVVYYRYADKMNNTVVQPAASEAYEANMPAMRVEDVPRCAHAGFLENYDANVDAIQKPQK